MFKLPTGRTAAFVRPPRVDRGATKNATDFRRSERRDTGPAASAIILVDVRANAGHARKPPAPSYQARPDSAVIFV
jgi:hypothetical protein